MATDSPSPKLRYRRLAEALLSSDNPTKAIAEMIGEHEGRLDGLADRVRHLECVHEMKSSSQDVEVR